MSKARLAPEAMTEKALHHRTWDDLLELEAVLLGQPGRSPGVLVRELLGMARELRARSAQEQLEGF
jgi:hypothetical protein